MGISVEMRPSRAPIGLVRIKSDYTLNKRAVMIEAHDHDNEFEVRVISDDGNEAVHSIGLTRKSLEHLIENLEDLLEDNK